MPRLAPADHQRLISYDLGLSAKPEWQLATVKCMKWWKTGVDINPLIIVIIHQNSLPSLENGLLLISCNSGQNRVRYVIG